MIFYCCCLPFTYSLEIKLFFIKNVVFSFPQSNKAAHVLCHIPALSILSESRIGEWFFAPEEITVLAQFFGNNDISVSDLEVGQNVKVVVQWLPNHFGPSVLFDAHNAWKVTQLKLSDKNESKNADVDLSSSYSDVDYFGLNVVSCIARTDHHMYLVVEVVDWNSPDAKLKAKLPKKISSHGNKVIFFVTRGLVDTVN